MKGFHGTNRQNFNSISANNFSESNDVRGVQHWFGNGAYFFIEGSNSIDLDVLAEAWAQDHIMRTNNIIIGDEYCVVTADIIYNGDLALDLTESEGLRFFNEFKNDLISALRNNNKKFGSNQDHFIFESIKKKCNIEFIKGNQNIYFKTLPSCKYKSRMPNCTIIAVSNPSQNIDITSIHELRHGVYINLS